jgi:hypothetical protein
MRELRSDLRIIAGSSRLTNKPSHFAAPNDLPGQAGEVDTGRPMDSKLGPAQADPQEDLLLAPKD